MAETKYYDIGVGENASWGATTQQHRFIAGQKDAP